MNQEILKSEEKATLALRELYRRYGYTPYKMSRFEEYDLYVRSKDFLVSDQIITFSGPRGKLMAMKPDVTMSIVKNAPEEPGVVQKVYYNENVYRDYREILQAGLECVGDLGSYEIGEVVLLAARSLQLLGESYVLDLSHMGLIAAVMDRCGLEGDLRQQAMDCLRRKNLHGLSAIPGAGPLETLLRCEGDSRNRLNQVQAILATPAEWEAWEEVKALTELLEEAGFGSRIRLDFSVGNNMRYYSGVVFRGYLAGVPTSILSGGQYDRLPRKLGRKAKAIGFAIYLDLLEGEAASLDVDTLILHDGSVCVKTLAAAAAEAEQSGSVLVAREIPKNRGYKTMIRFEKGEKILC